MRIVRTALFTADETKIIHGCHRFIDIAYPLRSDPLVQRSPEALARAVDETDPRRRGLGPLLSPWSTVTYPQVLAARDFLDVLLSQMEVESSAEHWLALSDTPEHPQSRQMAEVLAAERTGQQRHVREALVIVTSALDQMSPEDDPTADRYADDGF